jgi:hypothetical protein
VTKSTGLLIAESEFSEEHEVIVAERISAVEMKAFLNITGKRITSHP